MVHPPHPPFTSLCIRGEKEPHLLAVARAATAFCGGKARYPFIMHTDYVSMGGKNFLTPLFLPYIRSTLEVHFFDFILGRATPLREIYFLREIYCGKVYKTFWRTLSDPPPPPHGPDFWRTFFFFFFFFFGLKIADILGFFTGLYTILTKDL